MLALLGLFGAAAGGVGGWFTASFIMKLGLLGLGFRFLGAILSSLTITLSNTVATFPPLTGGWLCVWVPCLGFSVCASAATAYSFAVQGHRALWLAILVAVLASALDLYGIVRALRAKAREVAEDYAEQMRMATRYGYYY